MALFSRKPIDYSKFHDLEDLYMEIISNKLSRTKLLETADKIIDLCSSFTADEEKAFTKYVIRQSRRDRSRGSYVHPVYGRQYESRPIIREISGIAANKKATVLKAIEREKEFAGIEVVLPFINNDYKLEEHSVSELPEIKIQNITKSFDADSKLRTFVVIDLETTGIYPGRNKIVQVAAIRYEHFVPTESFVSYVNPGVHIPEESTAINGIHDEDVREAPQLQAIAEDYINFIGTSPVLGYNVSFDLSFLYCAGIDLITKRRIYDAKTLAKKLYKKDIDYYSLANLLAYKGITVNNLHDARVDCYATGMVFMEMIKEITE
ncbi:MAG: 3'-5' exonuclease [Mogibacterium sp.]|nr:3'-5' exonuclease [Mogibacterium sp.]